MPEVRGVSPVPKVRGTLEVPKPRTVCGGSPTRGVVVSRSRPGRNGVRRVTGERVITPQRPFQRDS